MRLRLYRRLALLLPVFLLAGCDQSAPAPERQPPEVTVARPLVREITEWDEYTGRFQAVDSVEVRARVSGYLDSVHFTDGEMVEKGALLFVIDQRPFKAALARARARVDGAKARLEFTRTEVSRAEALMERNNISKEQYDLRLQEQRQAEADLAVARAERRQAELDLAFTEVRAPISGRISRRLVDVGNLINGGNSQATLLTTIVSLDPIHFVFDASERAFLKYQRLNALGQRPSSRDEANPVKVKLADEDTFVHEGRMDFVDNRVDPGTGTMRGRAIFENDDLFLTPGIFGRLKLKGRGPYRATLLPDRAIATDQDRKFVYVVDDNNMPQPRTVETGAMHRGLRVIRAGVGPEDRVIVSGLMFVRPGLPVRPDGTELSLADE